MEVTFSIVSKSTLWHGRTQDFGSGRGFLKGGCSRFRSAGPNGDIPWMVSVASRKGSQWGPPVFLKNYHVFEKNKKIIPKPNMKIKHSSIEYSFIVTILKAQKVGKCIDFSFLHFVQFALEFCFMKHFILRFVIYIW